MLSVIKLFVCYRSTDAAKVDPIIARLKTFKSDDGSARYICWQDKQDIIGGQDWWEAILDAIDDCQIFVLFMSEEAIKSHILMTEWKYASKRNFPIIPIVLEGEYLFNNFSGKTEINHWRKLPPEMEVHRFQLLFYDGTGFYNKFEKAVNEFISEPRDLLPFARPIDPHIHGSLSSATELYSQACDYAYQMDFEIARRFFQRLINRKEKDFKSESVEWIKLLNQYEELLKADVIHTRYRFNELWQVYQSQFPKPFLADIYDPKEFRNQFHKGLVNTTKSTRQINIQEYLEQAQAFIQKGDYQSAIIKCNYALRFDPNNPQIYIHRAVMYTHRGDFDLAISDFSNAIDLNDQDDLSYNNRAYLYHHKKKDLEQALADYNKAIKINSKQPVLYSNRGWVYIEKRQYNRAIIDLNKAIQLNPLYATAYNNRGWAYIEKREYDRALSDLDEAIRLDPQLAMAYNNRGWAYNQKGKYDKAIMDLNKAIEIDPGIAHAYNNRGNSYFYTNQYELALEDYLTTLKIDPNHPYALSSLIYLNQTIHIQNKN